MKACKDCGHVGAPATITKGQFWVEVALWLCFLVPGLIYSVWRIASRVDGCAACGSQQLIPVDSPTGRKIAAEYQASHPVAQYKPIKPRTAAVNLGRKLGKIFAKIKQ